MKIIKAPDLLQITSKKHLLLDTNVFIDAFSNPIEFATFFNELRDNYTTLVTLDLIRVEFVKGAFDEVRIKEKEEFLDKIVATCLPSSKDISDNILKLLKRYKEDGKGVSIVDLLLGANLMKYSSDLFLLSRDASAFQGNIFELVSYVNLVKNKSLQCYGVYAFKKS